uniref:thiosulfate:glutathione sulfurtransferase-like isoform X1 n=1 Tax=Myxine glutinosa TaxID=7769 RepID=UPI00358E5473
MFRSLPLVLLCCSARTSSGTSQLCSVKRLPFPFLPKLSERLHDFLAQQVCSTDTVTYEELKQMISDGAVKLFDVREPDEFSNGSIPTATNIPLGTVQEAFSLPVDVFEETYKTEMPTKADGSLVVYCRSGTRSLKALNILKDLGYSRARHYPDGYLGWVAHELGI